MKTWDGNLLEKQPWCILSLVSTSIRSYKSCKRISDPRSKLRVAGFGIELNCMKQEGDGFDSRPGPFCVESAWSLAHGGRFSTSTLFSSFGLKTVDFEGPYAQCVSVCLHAAPGCTLYYCPLGQAPANLTSQFSVTQFIARWNNPHKKGFSSNDFLLEQLRQNFPCPSLLPYILRRHVWQR